MLHLSPHRRLPLNEIVNKWRSIFNLEKILSAKGGSDKFVRRFYGDCKRTLSLPTSIVIYKFYHSFHFQHLTKIYVRNFSSCLSGDNTRNYFFITNLISTKRKSSRLNRALLTICPCLIGRENWALPLFLVTWCLSTFFYFSGKTDLLCFLLAKIL